MNKVLPRGIVRERGEQSSIGVHAGVFVDAVGRQVKDRHGVLGANLRHKHVQRKRVGVDGEGTWHVDMRLDVEFD